VQLRTGQRNASAVNAEAPGGAGAISTGITDFLMYKLWTGLLVRTPDEGVDAPYKPATFWRWDINVPNQFYLLADPTKDPYSQTLFGYVVDPAVLDWKHETLYPADANACDSPSTSKQHVAAGRCTYLENKYIYDCPGAVAGDCGLGPTQFAAMTGNKLLANVFEKACHVLGAPKVIIPDPFMGGAGNHKCRGCHFYQGEGSGFTKKKMAFTVPPEGPLFQGRNCQCKCNTPAECTALAHLIVEKYASAKFPNPDWDFCWTDNLNLQAALQNGLWQGWLKRDPKQASSSAYWGWSEVAVPKRIDEPQYYAASMIYITPKLSNGQKAGEVHGLEALNDKLMADLDKQIGAAATGTKTIKVGAAFRGQRPGSDVVIARQNYAEDKYSTEFFCQEYTPTSKGAKYKICAKAKTPTDPGYCFLEYTEKDCPK